jgi:hypothetical protein
VPEGGEQMTSRPLSELSLDEIAGILDRWRFDPALAPW